MAEVPTLQVDDSLLEGFIDESLEALAVVDELLVRLEKAPENIQPVHDIFRPVHSIKGNAPFFGLTKLRVLAHELESLLALVRNGTRSASKPVMDVLLTGIDALRSILQGCRTHRREIVAEEVFSGLVERIIRVRDREPDKAELSLTDRVVHEAIGLRELLEYAAPPLRDRLAALIQCVEQMQASTAPSQATATTHTPPVLDPAANEIKVADNGADQEIGVSGTGSASGGVKAQTPRPEAHKSMRVSEEHVDSFLSYVGELFTFGETLSYLIRRLAMIDSRSELTFELTRQLESFKRLVQNMQLSVMSIRKVAVKLLLNKVPRMVRDIASNVGKEIEVTIEGQEVEVDKSLIELLDAPLTHMVRNAADHGIELPADRARSGKPQAGTISVRVSEEDKHIVLEVSDDGAGLNHTALQRKAEALGIVMPGQKLTEHQIVDLIFAAGVSTAREVTDISGRGVGMEVVKRAIEDAGGQIQVTTNPGQGTKFRVALVKSVTTNIVEGIIFRIGVQHFIMPAERVIEVSSFDAGEKLQVDGVFFVRRHGSLVPIVLLRDVFHLSCEGESENSTHIITVKINNQQIGLLVDEVLAMQQVVVKELKSLHITRPIFTGATLIGDGQIALLLDVDAIETSDNRDPENRRAPRDGATAGTAETERDGAEKRSLLIVESNERPYAIPLDEVHRLEHVSSDQVEYSAGHASLQYDETIMPLLSLGGDIKETANSTVRVVVTRSCDGFIGFVVDRIVDIIEQRAGKMEHFESHSSGYQGSTVIGNKVTDLISVRRLVESNRRMILSSYEAKL